MRGVYEKVKGSKDFYIRYTDANGHRHREHVGRYSAAVEVLVNRRRELREGRFIAPHVAEKRISFAELADKMMADRIGRMAPNTIAGNLNRLRRLKPMFGNVTAKEVTSAKINEVLRELKFTKNRPHISNQGGETLTPGQISGPSLNGYLFFMRSIFSYGIEHGYLDKNPVRGDQAYPKHEGNIRYLTSDEEHALRKVIQDECPEFLFELDLALNTGLRKHEQHLLTWDKIDLDRGILTVPSETKTGRRYIPINSVCRTALEQLHQLSDGSAKVCPWNWRTKGKWLRKWLKKAGVINFRWHDLRHTFASRLVMAGVDLRTVQTFMGHSQIETTMRYAHLSPEHCHAAIERLVPVAPAKSVAGKVREIA